MNPTNMTLHVTHIVKSSTVLSHKIEKLGWFKRKLLFWIFRGKELDLFKESVTLWEENSREDRRVFLNSLGMSSTQNVIRESVERLEKHNEHFCDIGHPFSPFQHS